MRRADDDLDWKRAILGRSSLKIQSRGSDQQSEVQDSLAKPRLLLMQLPLGGIGPRNSPNA